MSSQPNSEKIDAERALLGLFDFERERSKRHQLKPFTLDRIHSALDILGHPEEKARIVHIAGTKGKGSTLEYLYRLLHKKSEMKIGLFTSPHLIRLHERIRIDGVEISDQDLLSISEQVDQLNREHFNREISYFEVLLLIAFIYFEKNQVDWIILETGLGGRLDATNVVQSDLAMITKIDYDHMDVLGDTLELIASEKAGIIKGGEALVLKQNEEVCQVIEARCRETQAKLEWVDAPFGLPPAYENANMALHAAKRILPEEMLWPSLDEIVSENIPGRQQCVKIKGHQVLIDSAHNAVSIKALSEKMREMGMSYSLCFAFAQGRDVQEVLNLLMPYVDDVAFCILPGGRPGILPDEMLQILQLSWPDKPAQIISLDQHSWMNWIENGQTTCKVITGSFYLAGEALKCLPLDEVDG